MMVERNSPQFAVTIFIEFSGLAANTREKIIIMKKKTTTPQEQSIERVFPSGNIFYIWRKILLEGSCSPDFFSPSKTYIFSPIFLSRSFFLFLGNFARDFSLLFVRFFPFYPSTQACCGSFIIGFGGSRKNVYQTNMYL